MSLFHVSPIENRQSIASSGICVRRGGEPGYFLSAEPDIWINDLANRHHGEYDVWKVDVTGLELIPDEFGDPQADFYVTEPIGLSRVTLRG